MPRACPVFCWFNVALGLAICIRAATPAIAQPPGLPPAAVVVAIAEEVDLEPPQRFVGTVMPRRRSTVGSAVDGRVTEYLVRNGDFVTEGQPLAQLLTETLKIELAAAEAELELRKQEYDELRNGSLPEEITQSRARLDQAKALSDFASAKQRRWRMLYEKGGSTSQDEFEEVNSSASAAEQQLLAAKAAYELSVKGPRAEKIAQAYAKLGSAKEAVRLLEDRLKKFTIRAPFNGYVVQEFTEVGAWINKGDKIAEVIELDWVEIEVAVPEDRIPGLQQAMMARAQNGEKAPAAVELTAMAGQAYGGAVKQIVPQAEVRSRTFPVKVELKNPKIEGADEASTQHVFHAGMLANVTLPVGKRRRSLVVPKDALVLGGATPVVFVVVDDAASMKSVVRPVSVKTGLSEGGRIQIIGDVKAGEQVVVRGNERLRPGQPVMVAPAGK